jgi:hypothetical protein
VISETALAITLAATLMLVTYSTSIKAFALYKKENEQKAAKANDIEMITNPILNAGNVCQGTSSPLMVPETGNSKI